MNLQRNIPCSALCKLRGAKTLLSIMDESDIGYEILAYLSRNPNAQDTIDGIVEWWLLDQHIERQIAKVKSALTDLVERGLILKKKNADSLIYYCLNRRRQKEIAEILNQVRP